MFANILLAIDPNHPESWRTALPKAADEARQSGGRLHIVAVAPDFGMTIVRDYFPKDFERQALIRAKADLEAFVKANVPPDVEAQAHLAHGEVSDQILKTADALDVDLIVMAAHQPDELRTFLVGSHADRVARRARMSVLIVRDGERVSLT